MTQKCFVITDGSMGMEKQCIALAEALQLDFEVKRIEVKGLWSYLSPIFWFWPMKTLKQPLTPPWPEVIITCGRSAIAPTLWIKKQSPQTFVIKIQNPRVFQDDFDLILTPEHDLIEGPNIMKMLGSLHTITPDFLKAQAKHFEPSFAHLPKPRMGLLMGGSQKGYGLTEEVINDLIGKAKTFHKETGGSLLVTISRRTEPLVRQALAEKLQDVPHFFWNFEGENPYFGILGCADLIVPTADSVNMCAEAAASGKPVYIYHYGKASPKFQRFHKMMQEKGYARIFDGHYDKAHTTKRLDEIKDVAARIQKLLKKTFSSGKV